MKHNILLCLTALGLSLSCTKTVEKIITPEFVGSIVGKIVQTDSAAMIKISQATVVDSTLIDPTDGSFLLDAVPAGNYDLTVKSASYGSYRLRNVEVQGGAKTYVGEIRLSNWPDLIADVYPTDQSEVVFDRRWSRLSISVQFETPMDRASVEAAFSTDPPSEGIFYWGNFAYAPTRNYYWDESKSLADNAGYGANISTFENITAFTYRMAQKDGYVDTTYTVTLAESAVDTAGNALQFPLSFSFSTVQSSVSQNAILTQPENGELFVEPMQNASIYLTFPRRMDEASTEASISISPELPITPLWPDMNQLRIFTGGPLMCETLYTIRIDGTAQDLDGVALGEDYEFSFETAPLELTSTNPQSGQIFVSRNADINLQFNTYMNLSAVRDAFDIQPAVTGSFFRGYRNDDNQSPKNVVTFDPSQNLRANTKYTVTIGLDAADLHGSKLPQSHSFSFVTEME